MRKYTCAVCSKGNLRDVHHSTRKNIYKFGASCHVKPLTANDALRHYHMIQNNALRHYNVIQNNALRHYNVIQNNALRHYNVIQNNALRHYNVILNNALRHYHMRSDDAFSLFSPCLYSLSHWSVPCIPEKWTVAVRPGAYFRYNESRFVFHHKHQLCTVPSPCVGPKWARLLDSCDVTKVTARGLIDESVHHVYC